jgi:3-phenylpropionate/trans-cinnamate dioxygenase ferredoxin reductase subunit
MKIIVDLGLCQGYGNCVTAAPDFFDLDDSGQVKLLKGSVETEEDVAAVRAAISQCPMSAIRFDED